MRRRTYRTRFWQVRPRLKWLVVFALVYLPLTWVVFKSGALTLGPSGLARWQINVFDLKLVLWSRLIWCAMAVFVVGVCRGGGLPHADGWYGQWLALTPWTPGRPLPLAPATLVWEDLPTVAAFTLLGISNPLWLEAVVIIPTALLGGYALSATASLGRTSSRGFALANWALLPMTVYFWPDRRITPVVVAMMCLLATMGVMRTLAGFPWNTRFWTARPIEDETRQLLAGKAQYVPQAVVWPEPAEPRGFNPAILIRAAMTAWYFHAAVHVIDPFTKPRPRDVIDAWVLIPWLIIVVASSFRRLRRYTTKFAWPLGFKARLLMWTPVIPGFDVVFIAPLAGLITGLMLGPVLLSIGWRAETAFPLAAFAAMVLNNYLSPNEQRWRLLGQHRVIMPEAKPSAAAAPDQGPHESVM